MTQIISRIYGSQERAANAARALEDHGFSDLDIFTVLARSAEPDAAQSPARVDDLVTSIMKGHIVRSKAEIYAEAVRRGGSLVTVHAPFGSALPATRILDSFEPIPSGVS